MTNLTTGFPRLARRRHLTRQVKKVADLQGENTFTLVRRILVRKPDNRSKPVGRDWGYTGGRRGYMLAAHPDFSRLAEGVEGPGFHQHLCLIHDTKEEPLR